MKKVKSKAFLGLLLLVVGIPFFTLWGANMASLPVFNLSGLWGNIEDELKTGKACTIKDEQGNIVTIISRQVHPGDEIITAEGKRFKVRKTVGDEAVAGFAGMDQDLLAYNELFSRLELPAAKVSSAGRPVAIYHTHSDESYLPSDGKGSIEFHGGIFQVGDSYKNKLMSEGTTVFHDKTPHDPHDNNAYYRSRRTAAQLLKKNPIAIFDVHRDGIENAEFYRRTISNQDVAQMRLVVGAENPRKAANLDFAKRLMAYANKMHWPITKEIYIGKGSYNQDLSPTSLLIEAGTYTNKKEEAMRGISQLAEAVPVVLGITGPGSRPGASEYGKPLTDPTAKHTGGWTALAWILAAAIIGGGAFLIISSGGWGKAKDRLRYFFGKEFTNYLGPRLKLDSRFKKINFKNFKRRKVK